MGAETKRVSDDSGASRLSRASKSAGVGSFSGTLIPDVGAQICSVLKETAAQVGFDFFTQRVGWLEFAGVQPSPEHGTATARRVGLNEFKPDRHYFAVHASFIVSHKSLIMCEL